MNMEPKLTRFRRLIIKPVFTWSSRERKIRLFRITYHRQKRQITFGLQPNLFRIEKRYFGSECWYYKLWFLGIVFHWHSSFGGVFPD